MTARVRVYLPTYRRGAMLRQAVQSLLDQTERDWVCELHNDDPEDPFPAEFARSLADPRIHVVVHERNLGPTATFNLFFRGCPEPFYSILEDDNAWAPDFLATMLLTAERHPAVTVFWANMRVREEQPDGSFRDTGRCIHAVDANPEPQLRAWDGASQPFGAQHSNGAMLIRHRPGQNFVVPAVPFASIEGFRERMFPHPMVFVPRPLASFSVTRKSARSDDRAEWAEVLVLFAATSLGATQPSGAQLTAVWTRAHGARPSMHGVLLWVALLEPRCRMLLRSATLGDWFRFMVGVLRHPSVPLRLLRSRKQHRDWWIFLEKHTAQRQQESRSAHVETLDSTAETG